MNGDKGGSNIKGYVQVLVTEMREIKHYYAQGVQARKGIES
ncbi:MAG: cob(I)yrinic acid a,c-diamide adenosyltransferase [Gemmatimonadales bacterium]|jgi:ATP:corrinoid adenosyltransferase